MDDAGGLGGLRAHRDGPGASLGLAAREVALQAEQVIGLADEARQTAVGEPQRFHVLLGLVRIHLGQLSDVGLHLRRNRHRGAAVDLGQLGVHGVLVHVRDVEHRLHGEQVQLVDGRDLVLGQPQRAGAMALVQAGEHLARRLQLRRARLIALGLLFQTRDGLLNRGDIGQDELGLDSVHVRLRIHLAGHVSHVRIAEEAHHLGDGIGLADVREELVAQALPLARSGHQTGDVHELHRGGHDLRRMVDFGQRLQAVVGHRHDAHVGLDGGERVVGGQTALVGHRREQRGLADIRKPHDTD